MAADTAFAPGQAETVFTAAAWRGLRAPAFRWAIAPALAAWLLLLALPGQDLALCISPRASAFAGAIAGIAEGFAVIDPVRLTGEWSLMIVAMMFPLLVPMVGHVAARHFAVRRDRAVALFVLSYAVTWLAAALVASCGLVAARAGLNAFGLAPLAGLIGCASAALWQISPAKRRAVNRSHGTIALRPFGFAAGRDTIRFGLLHGTRCVRACLPTMVLPLLGEHGLRAMAVVFILLLAERARPVPQYGLSAIALLALGLTTLVTAAG